MYWGCLWICRLSNCLKKNNVRVKHWDLSSKNLFYIPWVVLGVCMPCKVCCSINTLHVFNWRQARVSPTLACSAKVHMSMCLSVQLERACAQKYHVFFLLSCIVYVGGGPHGMARLQVRQRKAQEGLQQPTWRLERDKERLRQRWSQKVKSTSKESGVHMSWLRPSKTAAGSRGKRIRICYRAGNTWRTSSAHFCANFCWRQWTVALATGSRQSLAHKLLDIVVIPDKQLASRGTHCKAVILLAIALITSVMWAIMGMSLHLWTVMKVHVQ